MAVIDLQGFVADLKDHVAEHGFHVHDERHFIETYTNRQTWEIDLHPDQACDGPLDLHVAIEVDPRTLIAFEDEVARVGETGEPDSSIVFPVTFSFALPPLPASPDLLILATDLAGIGGTVLPLDVSAVDSFAAVTDAADRAIAISGRVDIPWHGSTSDRKSSATSSTGAPAWPSSCSTARLFGSTTPSTELASAGRTSGQRLQRLEGLKGLVGMGEHVGLAADHLYQATIRVNDERCSLSRQRTHPLRAELLVNLAVGIAQQREAKAVLVIEFLLPIHRISADSHS